MNIRTEKLTPEDFDPSHDAPTRSWFVGPVEHDSADVHIGSTFHVPSRRTGINRGDENQGRGTNPPSVSASEWAWLIVGAALLGWVVMAAVGMSS